MNFQEVFNEISVTVLENVKKALDTEFRADKSFKAKVVEKINDYKYKVLYCGSTYTVSSSAICSIGDMVRVCAPNNNWQDLFILSNSSSAGREITDEAIWSQVTANAADIDRLKEEIANLETGGGTVDTEAVEKAQSTADQAQKEVDALEEDVAKIEERVADMESVTYEAMTSEEISKVFYEVFGS